MKKTTVFLVAAVMLVPSFTFAASLSVGQVNAIMGVLTAFGVSQPVLDQVYADLTATTTTSVATTTMPASTTTPTLAAAPKPAPVFTAATSTVIAPAQGTRCTGNSCITYGSSAAPTPPKPVYVRPIVYKKVCQYTGAIYDVKGEPYEMKFNCNSFESLSEARAEGYTFAYVGGLEEDNGVMPMLATSSLSWEQVTATATTSQTYYQGFPG